MLSSGTVMVFSSPGLMTSLTFMVSMAKPCSAASVFFTFNVTGPLRSMVPPPSQTFTPSFSTAVNMISKVRITRRGLGAIILAIGAGLLMTAVLPREVSSDLFAARDPGVRTGPAGAGDKIFGLTDLEQQLFTVGLEAFEEVQSVQGTIPQTEPGLGPRFNLDSCAGCHSQPAIGGTSPAVNPQVDTATKEGAYNEVPFFITQNGPVREARFKFKPNGTPDGGVHALFTITGRTDAPGCAILQPDFRAAAE